MRVGDLVRNLYTGEVFIVTNIDPNVFHSDTGVNTEYVEVDSQWLVPEEHLEVISESR